MFSSISTKKKKKKKKKKSFYVETKKFYGFYVFWTQAIILRKVVRRLASSILRTKL